MRGTATLAGAAVLAIATAARGEHTLTLDDALALARGHNRDLRAARERLAQVEQAVDEARAALLPTIVSQGKYTHNYKQVAFDFTVFSQSTVGLAEVIRTTTTNPAEAAALAQFEADTSAEIAATPPIQIQLSEQLDALVSASVPLIAPSLWYGLGAARASARSSEATYAVTEANVLVGVAQTFFAAAGSDELVIARENGVRVANETLEVARARVSAEVGDPVDVMRAETALVRAQQDLLEAENARGAVYRALATLLGTHEPIQVAGQAGSSTRAPTGDVVHGALSSRPELAADRAAIAAAGANARAALMRWVPTVSAFGTAHAMNYTGFSGDHYFWLVGLQLDWVLYDGGLRDAQRHIYESQQAELQARLELEADTIVDEVANAQSTVDTKRKAVGAAERTVALATESLRIIRAQYEASHARQLDVLQAQDSLVASQVALAQAHFDLSLAEVQLARAAGTFPASQGGP